MKTKNVDKRKIKSNSVDKFGIHFRSRLEASCYSLLKQSGLNAEYEADTFTLMPSYELLHTKRYERSLLNKDPKTFGLKLKSNEIRAITYTPDFSIRLGNICCYIDTKGFVTDRYALKKKLFLKFIDSTCNGSVYFFEPHNLSEVNCMINKILELQNG